MCLHFFQVCLPVKETAEIETGMAEKSSWDQANIRQKLGSVWRNRMKISQIIKDYFYLPFFLLIILCPCLRKKKNHTSFLQSTVDWNGIAYEGITKRSRRCWPIADSYMNDRLERKRQNAEGAWAINSVVQLCAWSPIKLWWSISVYLPMKMAIAWGGWKFAAK